MLKGSGLTVVRDGVSPVVGTLTVSVITEVRCQERFVTGSDTRVSNTSSEVPVVSRWSEDFYYDSLVTDLGRMHGR